MTNPRRLSRLPVLSATALAALFTAMGAQAQSSSLTMYGLIDLGMEYRTQNNAAGDSQWRLNSGGINTSRFGFKGKEDLGKGLSAQFNLEGELSADTGAADSTLFGRQAWISLDSDSLGSVALGRMSTVAYDFISAHDFMGYAPQYSWVTSTATVPKASFTSRISNGVRYLGTFGKIRLGLNAGLGEVAGSLNANTSRGVSVGYDDGPVSVQLSLDDGRTAATDTATTSTSNRSWIASGTYALGKGKVYAGVRDTKREPVGTVSASNAAFHTTLYWLGASAPVADKVTAFGGVYVENKHGTPSNPVMLAGKVHYDLSKRTRLYATAAIARAKTEDGSQTLTGVFRDQTPLTNHQTGIGFGLQHRF